MVLISSERGELRIGDVIGETIKVIKFCTIKTISFDPIVYTVVVKFSSKFIFAGLSVDISQQVNKR